MSATAATAVATTGPDPESIREWGAELGFTRVGFCRPDMALAAARHSAWIDAGRHGDMHYLARRAEVRAQPGLLLNGMTWAILVADPYPDPTGGTVVPGPGGTHGYIAGYARGAGDYHDHLIGRLKQLAERIRTVSPDLHHRVYVDTGPLLEKDMAAQAGLGWQGKHTNLVDPQAGNWFFLGLILTDLDLPDAAAAEPVPDRCGTCTRCLDICPTQAFPAPYQLDARRCISYLTIELKGPIPIDLRPLIGNRIFGCDDCLAACPWNRFAQAAHQDGPYRPRPITDGPLLLDLMTLTSEGFTRAFKRTPLFRTKRRGLLRNVAVALGNGGGAEALPPLQRALSDAEPLVRGHAAWALGQIRQRLGVACPDPTPPLQIALEGEDDPWVRTEITTALDTMHSPRGTPAGPAAPATTPMAT